MRTLLVQMLALLLGASVSTGVLAAKPGRDVTTRGGCDRSRSEQTTRTGGGSGRDQGACRDAQVRIFANVFEVVTSLRDVKGSPDNKDGLDKANKAGGAMGDMVDTMRDIRRFCQPSVIQQPAPPPPPPARTPHNHQDRPIRDCR